MSTILRSSNSPVPLFALAWPAIRVGQSPKPKKKSWSELSEIFVEIEKKEHEAELAKMTALK